MVFSSVWTYPHSVNLKTFHLIFIERLIDVFKQTWVSDISMSSPLVLYKEFRPELKYERYLDLLPFKLGMGTQLRLSAHQLRVVTGRYSQHGTE